MCIDFGAKIGKNRDQLGEALGNPMMRELQKGPGHQSLRLPRGTIGIELSLIKEMSVNLGHPTSHTWHGTHQSTVYPIVTIHAIVVLDFFLYVFV